MNDQRDESGDSHDGDRSDRNGVSGDEPTERDVENTDWSGRDPPLVRGTVVFEPSRPDLSDAVIRVELVDVTLADAPSEVVSERVLTDLSTEDESAEPIRFVLGGPQPDPRGEYAVQVHIDMNDSGTLTPGDYLNTGSCPVLTSGHSDQVTVQVQRIGRSGTGSRGGR